MNIWDPFNKKRLCQFHRYPTSIASLAFNNDGTMLAIASSYMHEKGDISHPEDAIFIRQVTDAETKPKWVFLSPVVSMTVCLTWNLWAAVFTRSTSSCSICWSLSLSAHFSISDSWKIDKNLKILPPIYTVVNIHSLQWPYNKYQLCGTWNVKYLLTPIQSGRHFLGCFMVLLYRLVILNCVFEYFAHPDVLGWPKY